MEKIVRISLSDLSVKVEPVPPEWAWYGGRAVTSTIVAKEVPPNCHPLGPSNKLVFAPGLLAGTMASDTGRLSAGAKSPLTGGIKESSAGGLSAQMLARLQIKALIVEGLPKEDKWYRIHINKDGASIHEETELIGLGNYALQKVLEERLGKKFGALSIGQAGEFRMAAADISARDSSGTLRSHGRGGLGAVMGSKRVKVITLDDTGAAGVQVADPEKFKGAAKGWSQALLAHPGLSQGMRLFGTAQLVNAIHALGGLPTHNFRYGQYEQHEAISGETMRETIIARGGKPTHSCQPGCVIQCSQVYLDKDGNFVTSGIEYETIALLGANCKLGNLDAVAIADRLMDDIGVDSIDTSCAMGVAMEAGLLPFGDTEGVVRLLQEEIAKGTPLGRILGGGAALTGKAYGITRVPVAKNQAFPAYDPRAIKGIGVTYATSPMGADHTAGYTVGATLGGHVNGLKKEGQLGLSKGTQIATGAVDSLGLCQFSDMALADIPDAKTRMVELINARVGGNRTGEECFDGLGMYVLQTERQFNLKAGLTSEHDRLPEFMTTDPLPPHNEVFDFTNEELDSVWNS